MTVNKRNNWLDLIKLMASFMVVFIHVDFTGTFGRVVNAIARFAVPLFFAVSGFFSLNVSSKTIKRRLLKLIILYFVATIIYHVYNVFGVRFTEYFTSTFTILDFLGFIFLNLPFSSVHLWFLLALIYVYLIWLLVIKFSIKEKTLFIISIVCLAIHLFLGEFLTLFNVDIPTSVVRNFVLMGFPFFTLGYLANKHKEKLKRTNNLLLIALLIFGCVEPALSAVFFGLNEVYIGSICSLFALIVIAIKLQEKTLSRFWVLLSSTSADVYVFHMLISRIGISIVNGLDISTESLLFNNLWPLIVCVICVALSLIKNLIVAKIKVKKGVLQ